MSNLERRVEGLEKALQPKKPRKIVVLYPGDDVPSDASDDDILIQIEYEEKVM